jgi:hypothetical protein
MGMPRSNPVGVGMNSVYLLLDIHVMLANNIAQAYLWRTVLHSTLTVKPELSDLYVTAIL